MRLRRNLPLLAVTCLAALGINSSPAVAQSGTGDVFGDLVHILRDPTTGQPILAQRWVELPGPVTGYGWGYCPVAVDVNGAEIGFIPYTCDPIDPTAVVDVDYFGRLNAGRTKERNHRMHFDEVISNIKLADWVDAEGSARLRLYFDCVEPGDLGSCLSSKIIDSPMENMGLYVRLVKYGHLQTDPEEINVDDHGDPNAPISYHPALGPEDWAKFAPAIRHLLPNNGMALCFISGTFVPACAEPELLGSRDLVGAAGFVAGAADKTGHFTADLVQYLSRILKLTVETEATAATIATHPAKVRDCWPSGEDPPNPPEDDPAPVDPPYLPPAECTIVEATPLLPNYTLFSDVQELCVDFTPIDYERVAWRSELVDLIMPVGIDLFQVTYDISLLPWLQAKNGSDGAIDLPGFVLAANDALRWIEFVHNYEIPDDLFATIDPLIFEDGFESGDTSAWSATMKYLESLR